MTRPDQTHRDYHCLASPPRPTQTLLLSGARLQPCLSPEKSSREFMIKVEQPIELSMSEDAEQDILAHSLIFNQCVESIIRLCPQQYLWMHDRWKQHGYMTISRKNHLPSLANALGFRELAFTSTLLTLSLVSAKSHFWRQRF